MIRSESSAAEALWNTKAFSSSRARPVSVLSKLFVGKTLGLELAIDVASVQHAKAAYVALQRYVRLPPHIHIKLSYFMTSSIRMIVQFILTRSYCEHRSTKNKEASDLSALPNGRMQQPVMLCELALPAPGFLTPSQKARVWVAARFVPACGGGAAWLLCSGFGGVLKFVTKVGQLQRSHSSAHSSSLAA